MTDSEDPMPLGPSDAEIRADLEGQRIRAELRSRLFGAAESRPRMGPYAIRAKIGAGGMGTVYDAEHVDSGERVALKVLREASDGSEARLRREGKALGAVDHDNLVRVHEIGRCDDGLYIAMEFVDGSNLRDWRGDGRPVEEVVRVLGEAAAGLSAAHERGLVHRDVKPDNILVEPSGRARVCDFGLATAVPGSDAEELSAFMERLTASGVAVGTIGYMAPEQLLGRPVSPATDQFALGATAFEALYGAQPFSGKTMDAVAVAILGGRVAEPDAIGNERLHAAILRALAREPEDRHVDIEVFARAMRDALQPQPRGWISRLLKP